jgi:adenylylsulfate kinase
MTNDDGWCVWVTGLPGSGKSTIAKKLLEKLASRKIYAQILSSDMLRRVVTPKPTYTEEERDIVYSTLVFIAKLLTRNGVNVIIDATANRRRYRDHARKEIPKFMEAYVRCPLEICIQRETGRKVYAYAPKEVYKKALTGKSATVPGVGVPYEEPQNPEVIVNSNRLSANECAQKILETLLKIFSI